MLETIENIFLKYNTDKNKNFHNYSRQYESLFMPFRDKQIKILEIGVFKGESLKALKECFKQSKLIGVDINNECKIYENINENIYIEIGNASDKNFIDKIINKHGNFDIILDDGSHKNEDVIKTFELLFPFLNDNGLYIVEDTVVYNNDNYINKNYKNHLEYFFDYTKFLNQWRYNSIDGVKDNCIDPFKIIKKTDNLFEYSIDKIEYGCSFIAIHKKIRYNWI